MTDLEGFQISGYLQIPEYCEQNTYGGAGRKYCYTAFAGVALEYTVEYAVEAFCLAELKGGMTILRACTPASETRHGGVGLGTIWAQAARTP